jgi:hypothetical protein
MLNKGKVERVLHIKMGEILILLEMLINRLRNEDLLEMLNKV